MDYLEKAIARIEANSGYERNTQRAADIRRIVMAAKLLPKEDDGQSSCTAPLWMRMPYESAR